MKSRRLPKYCLPKYCLHKYCLHKRSGHARVIINGVEHHLGKYGSIESKQYDALKELLKDD